MLQQQLTVILEGDLLGSLQYLYTCDCSRIRDIDMNAFSDLYNP